MSVCSVRNPRRNSVVVIRRLPDSCSSFMVMYPPLSATLR